MLFILAPFAGTDPRRSRRLFLSSGTLSGKSADDAANVNAVNWGAKLYVANADGRSAGVRTARCSSAAEINISTQGTTCMSSQISELEVTDVEHVPSSLQTTDHSYSLTTKESFGLKFCASSGTSGATHYLFF